MARGRVRRAVLFLLLLSGCAATALTGVAQSRRPGDSPFSLQVNTRVVLTDVTVTDRAGNPIHGLTRKDFQVFDNSHPQKISSFDVHAAAPSDPGAAAASGMTEERSGAPDTFSNGWVRHPPAVVNVLLIDATTIDMLDQMYLYEQMAKFVQKLPASQPVAVFARMGRVTVLLQSFTSDHRLLLAAIRQAIPHLRQPGYWMRSDEDTLEQVAVYLSQVPGRKNLLWFSSGSNVFRMNDPMQIAEADAARRELYDRLESERIVLYPIDVRGLTVGGDRFLLDEHLRMRLDAEATAAA